VSAGHAGTPYRLVMNGLVRESIRRLYHRSVVIGHRDRYVQTMIEIETILQQQPATWGDPFDTRPALRLTRYQRIYDRLLVRYAMHLDEPFVWLTTVIPVLKSPLKIGEG
jgi:hypothetical protein